MPHGLFLHIANSVSSERDPSRSGRSGRIDSFPSLAGEEECDGCDRIDPDLAYCNICNVNYCPTCWPIQPPHRKQRLASGQFKHEKTEITLARKIRNVLLPTNDIQTLTLMHEDDAQTAWFGKFSTICDLRLTKGQASSDLRVEKFRYSRTTGVTTTYYLQQWMSGVLGALKLEETEELLA